MSRFYTFESLKPSDEDVVRLTSEGFGRVPDEQFARDVVAVIDRCHGFRVAIDSESGNLAGYVGYSVYEPIEGRTLYLDTVMLDSQHQGRQLSSKLINGAIQNEMDIRYVSFKTQSARMYYAARTMLECIYPTFPSTPIPGDIQSVGDQVAAIRGSTFPIHRGSYGGGSIYLARQVVADHPEFYESINFEAGDAVFCVGKLVE